MTLDEALLLTQDILGEYGALHWSPRQLRTLLDLGQQHVAIWTLGYQRRVTFRQSDSPAAFLPLVREYVVAGSVGSGGLGLSDELQIQQLALDGNTLQQIVPKHVHTWNEHGHLSGGFVGWFEFADVLTFDPAPNAAALASYAVEIVYAALPAPWTSGASVLPEGLADLPPWFAAALACYSIQHYATCVALYTEYVTRMQSYVPVVVAPPVTARQDLQVGPQPRRAQLVRRRA